MKVLIVASGNRGKISSFIKEQADCLIELGVCIDFYIIEGKGIIGYLKNYNKLRRKINNFYPDILHAHYGLSGLLCAFQFYRPLIITYHGSDLELNIIKFFSRLSMLLSTHKIFVNKKQVDNRNKKSKSYSVIPCGINVEKFFKIEQKIAREYFGYNENDLLILFSSRFDEPVKNYLLAKQIIESLNRENAFEKKIRLIEFKNYSREETNLLYNAVDLLLITSINETGPLVLKEALMAGCPVLSTDVGDVSEIMLEIDRDWICSTVDEFKHKIVQIINNKIRFEDSHALSKYSNLNASKNVLNLYNTIYENH
jgi:teichuronic acid biosynthesis glycosyltransferase TuaC